MSYLTCHLRQGVKYKVMSGILQLTSSQPPVVGIRATVADLSGMTRTNEDGTISPCFSLRLFCGEHWRSISSWSVPIHLHHGRHHPPGLYNKTCDCWQVHRLKGVDMRRRATRCDYHSQYWHIHGAPSLFPPSHFLPR